MAITIMVYKPAVRPELFRFIGSLPSHVVTPGIGARRGARSDGVDDEPGAARDYATRVERKLRSGEGVLRVEPTGQKTLRCYER